MKIPKSLKDLAKSAETIVYIENLSNKKGLMQTLNPITKLITIAAMITSTLFITKLPYLLLICPIPLAFAAASQITPKQLLIRTALIPLFMAIISLPLLFITPGTPLWTTNINTLNITITLQGANQFLVFTLRIWFCAATLNLLILSTGFDKTLKLLSTLKVPPIIIHLFSLTYRYFFVSLHEAQSILIAKEARTYINNHTLNLQTLKAFSTILATLFIRTYERSERVYLAMKARGFEINQTTKYEIPPLHTKDLLFTTSIIVPFTYLALI
ncbi:MAG: cobalt ECF transporter T component CbiQ [Nitrososphaerota archaeon]|jgi:cobalt/nickel transport system permease protein|nr:cobalt ECF transporter T component CbiQ [Nitrososphaerota archaeon]